MRMTVIEGRPARQGSCECSEKVLMTERQRSAGANGVF